MPEGPAARALCEAHVCAWQMLLVAATALFMGAGLGHQSSQRKSASLLLTRIERCLTRLMRATNQPSRADGAVHAKTCPICAADTALERLDLASNNIGDTGAILLSESLKVMPCS